MAVWYSSTVQAAPDKHDLTSAEGSKAAGLLGYITSRKHELLCAARATGPDLLLYHHPPLSWPRSHYLTHTGIKQINKMNT